MVIAIVCLWKRKSGSDDDYGKDTGGIDYLAIAQAMFCYNRNILMFLIVF